MKRIIELNQKEINVVSGGISISDIGSTIGGIVSIGLSVWFNRSFNSGTVGYWITGVTPGGHNVPDRIFELMKMGVDFTFFIASDFVLTRLFKVLFHSFAANHGIKEISDL